MRALESLQQSRFMLTMKKRSFDDPRFGLIFAIPNGGLRNPRVGAKLKKEGVKAGVPDLFFPCPSGKYHGMFIEMKYGVNTTTKAQDAMLLALSEQGYFCTVAYSVDEAIEAVDYYLGTQEVAKQIELGENTTATDTLF